MKRVWLSEALDASGLAARLLHWRRGHRVPWLTCLTYHRVGPIADAPPLDPEVVTATATAMDEQLAFLAAHFDVLRVDDLLRIVRGGPAPPAPLLITFDDGYRDNYDVALPLLRKHGLNAVFFVSTDYIERRRLFWWDRIHYLLHHARRERVRLTYPHAVDLELVGAPDARACATAKATALVKHHEDLDLARFLDELALATGVDLGPEEERALAERTLMGWEQVRALRDAGMDLQSHTHTHRVLQTLSLARLDEELRRSRVALEERLGAPVQAIAYPVGKAPRYSGAIREAVRRAGYRLGFSNRSGVNPLLALDPLDVRRICIGSVLTPAHFRAAMVLPPLAIPGC